MKKLLLLSVFALMVAVQGAFSQKGMKIGIVDVAVIAKEMPEAKEADEKLKKLTVIYRDSLLKLEQDLQERYQQYEKQKAMMSPEQQKQEEEAIMALQMQGRQFQEEKLGMQGEIAMMRDSLLAPIREKIQDAIGDIAKEEEISLVLDKGSPAVLYSEDPMEITYKVLDMLKRGKNKK